VDLRGKRAGGGGEELQPHRPSTHRERERERESGWLGEPWRRQLQVFVNRSKRS
jgi:hypothetical protein